MQIKNTHLRIYFMVESINSRFSAIIDGLYKGNKRAFAQAIGVSPTVVENVVGTRQGKPSYDVVNKICANANISPEWLLTGNGPMLRSDEPTGEGEILQTKSTKNTIMCGSKNSVTPKGRSGARRRSAPV